MERSDEYMAKICFDALDREVVLDADIIIQYLGSKLKAYCKQTGTYVQFPRDIRKAGKRFVADVIKAGGNGRAVFYHAYKNSIRESVNGKVIA